MNIYNYVDRQLKGNAVWTDGDDVALICSLGKDATQANWIEIASSLHRSVDQCQQRYEQLSSGFTVTDRYLLMSGVLMFGFGQGNVNDECWKDISKTFLPNREPAMLCREWWAWCKRQSDVIAASCETKS